MAVPQRVGYNVYTTAAGTANSMILTPDGTIQEGDWMIAILSLVYISGDTITAPVGWTAIRDDWGTIGTFHTKIFAKQYLSSDTSFTFNFTNGGSPTLKIATASLAWVRGADEVDNWVIGTPIARPSIVPSTTFNNEMPAITTGSDENLILSLSFERTTAVETEVSSVTNATEWFFAPQNSTASNTIWVGYATQETAGTTEKTTVVYPNTQGTNGWGFQIGIPPDTVEMVTRPTIIGVPTTYSSVTSSVTSFEIDKPLGLVDGDVLIAAISAQSPTATSDFTSDGWSRIGQPIVPSSPGYRIVGFYALPVPVADDVSDSSFTFANTDSVSGGRIVAEMFIVRGADLDDLVSAQSVSYSTVSERVVTVTSSTPQVDNNLLLVAYNAQFFAGTDYTIASGPAGMTEQQFLISSTDNVSKTALVVYEADIEAGPISPMSLTWDDVQAQTAGTAVAIRGLGYEDPHAGIEIRYTSAPDTLSVGYLQYTSATDTLAEPAEVRPFPTGYASVTEMLATPQFSIAHRGGSGNWPEMSLYAYTQAGFWGVGAFELSLARTSDGVWFGLHDSSLDRTSLGSAGSTLVASSMTWEQVQNYQILGSTVSSNPTQPDRPYMRWEEIMDAYYGTHVIFIDPKVAGSHTAELLDMMDAMPGTPTDHFVAKFYGVSGNVANTTGWAHDASERGYTTWGYFYQDDAANIPTYQGRWDILGMDYNADQSTWDDIKSYGKKVIGHIIQGPTGASTAYAKGADGIMVAGVKTAITRTP